MAEEQAEKQDVDYWVEHSGALGLRPNIVFAVLDNESRSTFTEAQVKDLVRKAVKREVPPDDGTVTADEAEEATA